VAKVIMDIPDELIHDMENIEKTFGLSTNELVVSAIRRFVDKRSKLVSQAMRK
jgi:hypothetical protein